VKIYCFTDLKFVLSHRLQPSSNKVSYPSPPPRLQIKPHTHLSTPVGESLSPHTYSHALSCSSNAFASFRSRVSNPSVNQRQIVGRTGRVQPYCNTRSHASLSACRIGLGKDEPCACFPLARSVSVRWSLVSHFHDDPVQPPSF
jgi:hypothetical protein